MFGVTHLLTYILGVIAIVLVPGPNSIYVLTTSARNGIKSGYGGALGVFVGDSTLMSLSALGAASVLHTNLLLFNIVRLAGAAYLCYLGVGMLLGGVRSLINRGAEAIKPDARHDEVPQGKASFWSSCRKALMISLINPKAILFFLSFFVQFVDPAYAYPTISFLVLGAIMQCFSMCYLSVLIVAGSSLARIFSRQNKLKALLHGLIGGLFVSFGIRLAA
jgi:leucine efflux protein